MMQQLFSWQRACLTVIGTLLLGFLATTGTPRALAATPCEGSCVTLSPAQGPTGTQVSASGSQWPAGDQIQAIWGSTSGSDVGSPATVSSSGTFTLKFAVPANAALGDDQVIFYDSTERYFETASTPFDVTTPKPPHITITKVYARNGSGTTQTIFAPGAAIQYTFYVDNTGDATTASIQFIAYWGTVEETSTEVVDQGFKNVRIPAGVSGFYNPESVPSGSVPGPYTIRIIVTYNGATISSTSPSSTLTVTGNDSISGGGCSLTSAIKSNGALPGNCGCPNATARTCITYWDQYAVYQANSLDCGPTSVAMALSYYLQGPKWYATWTAANGTGGRKAGLKAIRSATGVSGDLETTGAELGKAITHYGGTYSMTPATGSLEVIAGAIRSRDPVIAFVNGPDLGRGLAYGDHWLVVRGFTANTSGNTFVVVYDPDQNPVSKTYAGGTVTIPLPTFAKAISDGLSGGDSSMIIKS